MEILVVGQLATNCYLFYDDKSRKAFIIDPGDDADFIIRKISDLDLKPQAILCTHGHFDHVLAVTELKLAFNIPFYLNAKDVRILKRTQKTTKYFTGMEVDPPSLPDKDLTQGQVLRLDSLSLKVVETPGHTQGSVSFYCRKQNICFVGDLIFAQGGLGRTDLAGGDEQRLKRSIKKILSLAKETIIYPGHGEQTTVEEEQKLHDDILGIP